MNHDDGDRSPPARIAILGCSGSGKSTLGRALSQRLGLPFWPTDDVYWQSDWTPTPDGEVRSWLDSVTARDRWILDGNFDAHRELLWGRADLAVWLDLPWTTTTSRVLRRNLGWWIRRTPVWGGQVMTGRRVLSGVAHAARSHAVKQKAYPDLLASFPNLQVVRIGSTAQLSDWMAAL